MKPLSPLAQSIRRGFALLISRRMYLAMFIVTILSAFFFVDLMKEGLPMKIPVAVIDQDHSPLSRQITRTLASTDLLLVDHKLEDYHDALSRVRSGEIFGFFMIPENFQKESVNGRKPTLTFYSNLTYYVPGSLSFKGFSTVAVAVTSGVVVTQLTQYGLDADKAVEMMQPVTFQMHPLNNPWANYSVYLSNSFIPGVLALMILIMTTYSICDEMKRGTSPRWLGDAGGSMLVAVIGKLLPQTVVWSCIGVFIQALLFRWCGFPLNNHASHLILAMVLMVIGCQAFAVIVCELIPNLRLALSVSCLTGILSFSITGFSFPVQNMYGAVGIFSYIVPLRYYFLIYIDQALNGIPIYYSRFYYAALLVFPLASLPLLPRLRSHCLRPVYVP